MVNLKPNVDHKFIEPKTSGSIGIELIRELKAWAKLKPFSNKQKIVLIKKAQNLTIQAQNAMLKLLEEPPERTILILVTNDEKSLLPTVVSRCRKLDNQTIKQLKELKVQIEKKEARSNSLTITNNSSKSLSHKSNGENNQIFTPEYFVHLDLIEKFQIAEKLSKENREKINDILDYWILHLRKQLISRFKRKTRLLAVDGSSSEALAKEDESSENSFAKRPLSGPKAKGESDYPRLAGGKSISTRKEKLLRLIKFINQTKKAIDKNVNVRLAIENLMMEIT